MLKRKYCAYYLFPVPIGIVTMGRDCLCGTGRLTGLLAIPKIWVNLDRQWNDTDGETKGLGE